MHGGGGIEFNSLIVISYAAPSHAAISCTTCLIVNWLKIKKKNWIFIQQAIQHNNF